MKALYVALGDSLTAGYGVRLGSGFAEKYTQILQAGGKPFHLLNIGVNGLTVGGLNALLLQRGIALNVARSELITLTIGSNDLLGSGRRALQGLGDESFLVGFSSELDLLGQQIRRLNPLVLVQVANLYNPLPAGSYAQYTEQAQVLINQTNKILQNWGKKYGFQVLRIDRVFRGREKLFIGPDSIHPNALGYEAMASAFR